MVCSNQTPPLKKKIRNLRKPVRLQHIFVPGGSTKAKDAGVVCSANSWGRRGLEIRMFSSI